MTSDEVNGEDRDQQRDANQVNRPKETGPQEVKHQRKRLGGRLVATPVPDADEASTTARIGKKPTASGGRVGKLRAPFQPGWWKRVSLPKRD